MKSRILLFMLLIASVIFTGCRSSRKASKTVTDKEFEQVVDGTTSATKTTVTTTPSEKKKHESKASSAGAVSSKMNLSLSYGGNSLSCGGTCRMKRDDVVQLNLTYTMLVTINVGTLEFTRDSILIVDRLNKRYCRTTYRDIPQLAQMGIDFYFIQDVFWGDMREYSNGDTKFGYEGWTDLGNGKFPSVITASMPLSGKVSKVSLSLNNVKISSEWEPRTVIDTRKFTQVSAQAVMSMLTGLIK